MGLGKTVIALCAARAWQRVGGWAVLVLCPVSVRPSWEREAAAVGVAITTHSWGAVPPPPPADCKYVLVADEAHYMQSMESQRTNAALRLAAAASAVILATGTPLKNARCAGVAAPAAAPRQAGTACWG